MAPHRWVEGLDSAKAELRATRKLFARELNTNATNDCLDQQILTQAPEGDDEDCSIAEEFANDEEHIAVDLARREGEKTYKFPKAVHTPTPKLSAKDLCSEERVVDRQRSISTMVQMPGSGFMAAVEKRHLKVHQQGAVQKEKPKEPLHAKPMNERTKRPPEICKGTIKEVSIKLEEGNDTFLASTQRISFFMQPTKRFTAGNLHKANELAQTMAPLELQRLRTNSIDSCNKVFVPKMPFGGMHTVLANRNSSVTPNARMLGKSIAGGQIGCELKQRFSALLNKGTHKFAGTTQAQPKSPHGRVDPDEQSRIFSRANLSPPAKRAAVPGKGCGNNNNKLTKH